MQKLILRKIVLIIFFSSIGLLLINCHHDVIDNSATLKFLVVGDWGRNGKMGQQGVANQMNLTASQESGQFIISTGDNFYEIGVSGVTDSQWRTSFEDVYAGNALQKDWYAVLGNHDYEGSPSAQTDYTAISHRWKMPARYFTVPKSIDAQTAVRFVFIDTNPFIVEYQQNAKQYADILQQNTQKQLIWLDSVLTNSPEKYKIVVGHHPIYSGGYGHGNQQEMIDQIKPILEKNNVQMYLCGHSHSSQYIEKNGSSIAYVVAGAGSQTDEVVLPESSVLFGTITPSFTLISLSKTNLSTSFIDSTGKILFNYKKNY